MFNNEEYYDVIIPKPGPLGITIISKTDENNRNQIYVDDVSEYNKENKQEISKGDRIISINNINLYNTTLKDAASIIKNASSPRKLRLMKTKDD